MSEKITIKEIARISGTSKTTVSFYLNGKTEKMSRETAQRIQEVIEQTGYRPSALARSLSAKHSRLIGVIIGDITNSFANQLVKGIETIAVQSGYQLMISSSGYDVEREAQAVERMMQMGVDGFIVQPTMEFEKIEKKIQSAAKPVVSIDSQSRTPRGMWVKTNNDEAVREAAELLSAAGYEKFLLLTAEPGILSARMERTGGFLDELRRLNRPCEVVILSENTEAEELTAAFQERLDPMVPTCLFVVNCWALPKVYLALQPFREKIPHQIGLIGFDNQEWTGFSSPTVSAIHQPADTEGKHACRILLDAIEGRNEEAPNQILKCTIHFRESTR